MFRIFLACLLVPLAGCMADGDDPQEPTGPQTHTVRIKDFAFTPKELDVNVGDTVQWINDDGAAHTVSEENYNFESGNLASGESFSYTFTAAGTFGYRCDIHPSMTGYVRAS